MFILDTLYIRTPKREGGGGGGGGGGGVHVYGLSKARDCSLHAFLPFSTKVRSAARAHAIEVR